MTQWPLGVCVFPEPEPNRPRAIAYPNYIHEILLHAGVCYTKIAHDTLAKRLDEIGILVTIGDSELPADQKQKLKDFVAKGGSWISIGGICGMEDVLGVTLVPAYSGFGAGARTLGEGYLTPRKGDHPMLAHVEKPLHFFNGLTIKTTGATVLATQQDAHGRPKDQPVILENESGKGRAIFIAVDLTGTIVHVQQGRAVTRDGVAAPDGTAPISDGVLKSGDGHVLDWIFDREPVPDAQDFNAFLRPIADLWREVLLRGIFYLAQKQNVPLPLLWLYPRNLPAIAHISHDTDQNQPPNAWALLDALAKANVKSTWCTILPGYDAKITSAIRDAGHELSMHFDTMTTGLNFTEAEFERQWRGLIELFGGEKPVSNKNHYLRWEGDVEFLEWLAKRGIQLDQTKGASKTGEAGFNFGTCHPHKLVRFDGSEIDVLELPTPTQDLGVFAPYPLLPPLLAAAKKAHGVLHLLFHPAHMLKEPVIDAFAKAAKAGHDAGLEWWTAKQINEWERARRKVEWDAHDGAITLKPSATLTDATIIWLGKLQTAGSVTSAKRWGFEFSSITTTLHGGQPYKLST